MTEAIINSAALDATDRVMDRVAGFIPAEERAAVWSQIFAHIQAGIVAVVGADRQQERFEPGRN